MKQLELRAYSKEEIMDITGVVKDAHTARNIKNTLTKWGYTFEYKTKQTTITRIPTTPEEKLNEILVRKFDMDIRTDAFAFGTFISELSYNCAFAAMPWEERSKYLEEECGVSVSDRTLKTWVSKLLNNNIISKDTENKVEWVTVSYLGQKDRYQVDDFIAEFGEEYFQKYKELRKQYIQEYQEEGMSFNAAYRKAVFDDLFSGGRTNAYKGVLLYKCSTIGFNAWGDNTLHSEIEEILDLCLEVADNTPFETEVVEIAGSCLERVPVEEVIVKPTPVENVKPFSEMTEEEKMIAFKAASGF